jgi:hypothetical protein
MPRVGRQMKPSGKHVKECRRTDLTVVLDTANGEKAYKFVTREGSLGRAHPNYDEPGRWYKGRT